MAKISLRAGRGRELNTLRRLSSDVPSMITHRLKAPEARHERRQSLEVGVIRLGVLIGNVFFDDLIRDITARRDEVPSRP